MVSSGMPTLAAASVSLSLETAQKLAEKVFLQADKLFSNSLRRTGLQPVAASKIRPALFALHNLSEMCLINSLQSMSSPEEVT